MKTQQIKIAAMTSLAVLALAGCSKQPDPKTPSRENFEAGLRTFLAAGNDEICLAMYDWPIDLTEAEAGANARHAVQLPVFEKLGLARSTIVPVPKSTENPDGAIKRYALTDEGRKYYTAHAHKGRDGNEHANDFCVAQISLDHVDSWDLDKQQSSAAVNYTYHIAAAPWMKDADASRVLPMVDRVIKGADGSLKMRQGFTLTDKGWVAVAGPV